MRNLTEINLVMARLQDEIEALEDKKRLSRSERKELKEKRKEFKKLDAIWETIDPCP